MRYGSSENDSKFRPPRGPRCRHTVGAKSTCACLALASPASCWPTSKRSFVFHDAAREIPQGKRAAYINVRFIRHSPIMVLTFVPALKIAPRAPFGPSLVLKAGIPFSGIAFDLQKSAAVRSETYRCQTRPRECPHVAMEKSNLLFQR